MEEIFIDSDAEIYTDIDMVSAIYSFPFKTEGDYDYQYRFIEEDGVYLIQIVKSNDDIDTCVELIKTILTIQKCDLQTTLRIIHSKNSADTVFTEFLEAATEATSGQ
jgi:hypothetical protein